MIKRLETKMAAQNKVNAEKVAQLQTQNEQLESKVTELEEKIKTMEE